MAAVAARYCAPRRSLTLILGPLVVSAIRRACLLSAALLMAVGPALSQDLPEAVRNALEDADRLRAAGRVDEARARYREVLKMDASVAPAYVGLGAIEHAAGKHEEALKIFVYGLGHAADDRTLLYNAAASALQTGKPKDALGYVDRALARNEKDVALHSLRGTILQRLDRSDDALVEFQAAVKLEPSAKAYLSLGNMYFRLGRHAEAIEAFQQATREDKSLLSAYYNLGAALYEAKRYDEALKAYEVALAPIEKDLEAGKKVEAQHGRAYLNLGAIYAQRQSWDRALDAYRKAERLDVTAAAAPYNVGYVLYRLERFDESYDAYTRAAKLDPTLPLAGLHRGLIELRRGKMDAAVALLEQALPRLDEDNRRVALVAMARAYQALGQTDKAREGYEKVLAARPDDLEALVGLGRLLRETGQIADARVRLEKARQVALESSGIALELAALAKAEGDRAQEKSLYAEVLKRDGDRPETWPVRLRLAVLLAGEGKALAARQEIEVLIKRPDGLRTPEARKLVRTAYGVLLARDGDKEGAAREFDAVLREDKGFAPAQAGVAVLGAAAGGLAPAQAALSSLILGTDFKEVRLLARLDLGKVLWLMGKAAEARPYLEATADSFPDDAAAQAALGEIALATGDRAGALRRLSSARDLCDATTAAPAPAGAGNDNLLRVSVGADPSTWLCPRVKLVLGRALLGVAVDALDRGRSEGAAAGLREARDSADKALALPLEAAARAVGLYVKGTANLLLDDVRGARRDLAAALAGELPANLVPIARNNLGAALYEDGAADEAQQQFETARSLRSGFAAATLNLGITLHAKAGGQPKALGLYEEYLALGGTRRDEVQKWADALKRVYR
jgi:tetratricopeptide (TPR) repeat protein